MPAAIERAVGIVLRTRRLTDTSLIVQWLTPDIGRIATVAKGALRPKSPFHGKVDLFYTADFTFSRSRRSELHTLRELGLRETYRSLREDLGKLQQACYCANLIEQTTEMETPVPAIFELLTGLLKLLPDSRPEPHTILSFELRLLAELGLHPDLDETRLTPGAKLLAQAFTANDWPMLPRLRPSDAQVKEINQFLHGFLIFHLGKIPKGRSEAVGA